MLRKYIEVKGGKKMLRLPKWLRDEIKKIVREAMDEWTDSCEYLTPNRGEGRYYCSKPDCEGVSFNTENS